VTAKDIILFSNRSLAALSFAIGFSQRIAWRQLNSPARKLCTKQKLFSSEMESIKKGVLKFSYPSHKCDGKGYYFIQLTARLQHYPLPLALANG
jgi:hypothetical protein